MHIPKSFLFGHTSRKDRPEEKGKSSEGTIHEHSKEDSAVPTAQDYVLEGAVKGIQVLKSSLELVGGVPGAQSVLELALVLIETCQDLTEIEGKVSELKGHIESITLAMVKAIEGKKSQSMPRDLLNDIDKLRTDLETIKRDLNKIAAQNRLLIVLFKTANQAKVERCMEILKNSLQSWQVSRDISHSTVLHDMEQKVDQVQEMVGSMQDSMDVLVRHAHTANHALTRQMPPKPAIFYGRSLFVEDIVKLLVSSLKPPRICIHAPGGMGKTTTAITIVKHPDVQKKFSERNIFWVPCVSANSPDILLHILYSSLRVTRDTGDYLSDIVMELGSSDTPRLILLDNFETPWDPVEGTRETVENILCSLSELSQVSILMTMRTNIPPSAEIDWTDKPLGAVDLETSKEIYCAIHPRAKGKPKLDELLAELGYMPFAITLMATLGKGSKTMPAAQLNDWRKYGPGMLSPDDLVEDSISRSIGLSINSKTIVNNIPARTLLATLAMLPGGTTHDHLDLWAPELGSKNKNLAISALSNVALVVDNELDDSEVIISVLPVVQSYMRYGDRIPPAVRNAVRNACYRFVLDHKSAPGDQNFKSDVKVLSFEESNIQAILLATTSDVASVVSMPDVEQTLEVLLAFSWYQHWTKPRTEVIEHTLEMARKAQNEQYIAECLFCLASTFFRMDRFENACQNFITARQSFLKISNTDRADECTFELMEAYFYMHKMSDAEMAFNSVSEEDMSTNAYVKARAKQAQGFLCWHTDRPSEALKHFDTAINAFEELQRPVCKAHCLFAMAKAWALLQKWPEALEGADQSLKLAQTFGPENLVSRNLCLRSALLIQTHAPTEEVIRTIEQTIQKGQQLGRPSIVAAAFNFFGEVHAKKRNALMAIKYFEAAVAQYRTVSSVVNAPDPRFRHADKCERNIQELKRRGLDANWDFQEGLNFLSDVLFRMH